MSPESSSIPSSSGPPARGEGGGEFITDLAVAQKYEEEGERAFFAPEG